jgi:hypothetical protein
MRRTTIEIDPILLQAIGVIARGQRMKVKFVSNELLRFAIPHYKQIFSGTKAIRRGEQQTLAPESLKQTTHLKPKKKNS